MASLAAAWGRTTRAAHLWGAAEAAREVTGIALPPGERALHEPYLASARSRLGEATWEAALAEGRAMSLEEGAEYALSKEEDPAAPTPPAAQGSADQPPVDLTPREKEIAVLVARELSNRQIASELCSPSTPLPPMCATYSRRWAGSRTQIAVWFTEQH